MTLSSTNPPIPDLAALIDRHGAARVFGALARAVLARRTARRRARLDADALSDHLRRDLGLPPATAAPRPWQSF